MKTRFQTIEAVTNWADRQHFEDLCFGTIVLTICSVGMLPLLLGVVFLVCFLSEAGILALQAIFQKKIIHVEQDPLG